MQIRTQAACILLVAMTSFAHATENLPVFGSWDCAIMEFTLTAKTYSVGGKRFKVKSIEKIAENAFGAELRDGYRFAMFDVTAESLTWHSPVSGDTFECRRK